MTDIKKTLERSAKSLAKSRKLLDRIDEERRAIVAKFESRYVTKPKRRPV